MDAGAPPVSPPPPPASMLYLHTVPPYGGGDTIFASMYAAYEALSPQAKAYLEPLTATHDGRPIFGPDAPVSVHPLIARTEASGNATNGMFDVSSATSTTRVVENNLGAPTRRRVADGADPDAIWVRTGRRLQE